MNYLSAGIILRQAIKVRQEAFIDRSIFFLFQDFYYVSIVKSSRRSHIFIRAPSIWSFRFLIVQSEHFPRLSISNVI